MTKEIERPLFPNKEDCAREIEWRERVQKNLPTGANQRRINYLRERFKLLCEEENAR